MSTVRINVEPTVIQSAVIKSGRSFEEVKKRFSSYDKWINNELNPTYNQLVDLSKFLRIPFGFLLVKTPVNEELPLLEFRTIDTEAIQTPSRELIDTIYDMERKQEWLRDNMIEDGNDPLDFVGIFKKNITYMQAADRIRSVFNLNKNWYKKTNSKKSTFNYLRDLFSQYGIVVMQNGIALNNTHRPLDLEEFRAFTLVDDYAPLIFLNNLDSNNGKTFSLLHEVAHIFFGIDSLYNDDFKKRNKYNSSIETICNKIAGELIAPKDLFINYWTATYEHEENVNEKIRNIANEFKVSKIVVARKALDQNYISEKQYDEVAALVRNEFQLNHKRKKLQKGGNSVNNALSRLDENFIRTLITNTEFGETQYNEAYRLAGVSRGVFEDLSERLKGVR